jgi:hypothetical protein
MASPDELDDGQWQQIKDFFRWIQKADYFLMNCG